MGFKAAMKKFGQVAVQMAPYAAAAAGLPASFAPALAMGVQIAQGMAGATNVEKAARAAAEAHIVIQQMNAIRVQHGLAPLVDEAVADGALAHAVKLTYDMSKMLHLGAGDPLPAAGVGDGG